MNIMPITQTPLRYPGGKSKLYHFFSQLLVKNSLKECCYVEPFAGGAGLALSLLLKGDVNEIIINDSDRAIYAFWYCVLNETDELIYRINNISINIDEWFTQKVIQQQPENYKLIDLAISTFFLNRTNRSGMLKGGIIGGIEQKGIYKIDSRFNKADLIRKISTIALNKERIKLYNLDIFNFIPEVIVKLSTHSIIYFDPPYIRQGYNLYQNYFKENDHVKLGNYIKELSLPWVLTYDDNPIIWAIYKNYRIYRFDINYSAGPSKLGREILICNQTQRDGRPCDKYWA